MKQKNRIIAISLMAVLLAGCGGKEEFDQSKVVMAYTRDTTSGTRDGFFTKIGLSDAKASNDPLSSSVVEVASNAKMIEAIKNDEYGIGYISLSSLEESTLKGLVYKGIEPTVDNVLNNTYSLTRNFNFCTRNDYTEESKEGQIVKAFVAYTTTIEGKTIIQEKDGILTISNSDKHWEDIKGNYPIVNEDNSKVTIRFGGSTSCEKIAKALSSAFAPLCGNFIAEHNHTGSGDAFKHTQGAQKDDANKLDIGFLSREFEENEPVEEGTYGKLCTDAIVAVVNEKNPYSKTDDVTLKSIYEKGDVSWSSLINA